VVDCFRQGCLDDTLHLADHIEAVARSASLFG